MDYLDRLIMERIDRDLPQREIAKLLQKTQQGYDHIEKRRSKLSIEDFMTLCEFYDLSPEYVLGYQKKKTPLRRDSR